MYRKLAGLQMTLYCKYIVSFAIYSIYIRSKFLYTFLHNKEVDNMLGGFGIYSKTADYALCGVSNIYVQFHSKKANQKRPNKIFDFRLYYCRRLAIILLLLEETFFIQRSQ